MYKLILRYGIAYHTFLFQKENHVQDTKNHQLVEAASALSIRVCFDFVAIYTCIDNNQTKQHLSIEKVKKYNS